MRPVILIAEDDADIRRLLRLYLESEDMEIIEVADGEEAVAVATKRMPDIAVLDIMMPRMDGLKVTQKLREMSNLPILILSAKSLTEDKIMGLNLGADDYITKPFEPLEVVARVKAMLRRSTGVVETTLTVGDLMLDAINYAAYKKDEMIPLTPTEFKLLSKFMHTPGKIFTKIQLSEVLNGEYLNCDDNTVMVHISNLREKIEDDPKNPHHIVTIRGLGYKFEKQEN